MAKQLPPALEVETAATQAMDQVGNERTPLAKSLLDLKYPMYTHRFWRSL
jgi:hypothetical protein